MANVSDDRSEGLEKLEGPVPAQPVTDCEGTHDERQVRMRELANVFIDIFFAARKEFVERAFEQRVVRGSHSRMSRIKSKDIRVAKSAIIYCRVSTDEQSRDAYGLESQERVCREYCQERGWTVREVFRDAWCIGLG